MWSHLYELVASSLRTHGSQYSPPQGKQVFSLTPFPEPDRRLPKAKQARLDLFYIVDEPPVGLE